MAEHLLPIVLLYLFHTPTQALPPPKLVVDKQLISETDSVTLDCQAPSYLPVFQCYFPTMGTKDTVGKQCRRTVTGGELLWRSQQTPPAVVQLKCFYTLKYGDVNSPSPHSNIWSITIQATGVLQTTRSAASTLGPSALGVTGSTWRPSTSTSPPPTSDGASEVPATLTPWLPTQTQTQAQTQTQTQTQAQGKGSGPFHPASSWSPAGWTLAHTDGFLTGGAASDERDEEPKNKDRLMAIMVIAMASFGVTVGVILLALTLRRTVSERRRRSEHPNIEDEYLIYSTITYELAPSVK